MGCRMPVLVGRQRGGRAARREEGQGSRVQQTKKLQGRSAIDSTTDRATLSLAPAACPPGSDPRCRRPPGAALAACRPLGNQTREGCTLHKTAWQRRRCCSKGHRLVWKCVGAWLNATRPRPSRLPLHRAPSRAAMRGGSHAVVKREHPQVHAALRGVAPCRVCHQKHGPGASMRRLQPAPRRCAH